MMRNALCHKYGDYLTLAAHFRDDFDCEHCRHRRSYHRQTSDLIGCYMLAAAVFQPELYKKYRGWKQGSTCLEIKSATRKRRNKADLPERVTMEDINALENEVFRIYKIDSAWRLDRPIKRL